MKSETKIIKFSLCWIMSLSLVACKGFEGSNSSADAASTGEDDPGPVKVLKVTLTSAPNDGSIVAEPSIAFIAQDNTGAVNFTCQLNGTAIANCTSPQKVTLAATGRYKFEVSAKDDKSTATARHEWQYNKPVATTGSAELSWDPNTESELTGYIVYYGTASKNYTVQKDVGLPKLVGGKVVHVIDELEVGKTYYFAVKAKASTGVESIFSNESSKAIPAN